MKNLLIVSGGAKNGNGEYISGLISGWAENTGKFNVYQMQLSDYNIEYCDGCLQCDVTGACHKKDDMLMLLDKVRNAHAMILISPTRWSLISGDLKVFFDRWNPLAGKNLFDGKKVFNICVGQTDVKSSVSILRALESLRFFVEDAGFSLDGQFAFENCYEGSDAKEKQNTIEALYTDIFGYFNRI